MNKNKNFHVNRNTVVLGVSGSGKSCLMEKMITTAFADTDDHIIIIDPYGDYRLMASRFGAKVIKVSLDSQDHIDPLDIIDTGDGRDPVAEKCLAVAALIQLVIGGYRTLSSEELSAVDRAVRKICAEYKGDRKAMPALPDLYRAFREDPAQEAQVIATAIEVYCSYPVFAEQTNIETDNRMIVYDISEMPFGIQGLAIHICVYDAWNRILKSSTEGVSTRLYMEGIHHLLYNDISAKPFVKIYKQARQYGCMLTTVTQYAGDLYTGREALNIISLSRFLFIMRQGKYDCKLLQEYLKIDPELMTYISDGNPGEGLLYDSNTGTFTPFLVRLSASDS